MKSPCKNCALGDHPSQDRTNRFAIDALLRKNGFKISSRHADCEPVWERGGFYYLQRVAEAMLDPDAVADAEYTDFLYSEGHHT